MPRPLSFSFLAAWSLLGNRKGVPGPQNTATAHCRLPSLQTLRKPRNVLLQMAKKEASKKEVVTREYTINIHKRIHKTAFKKRAPKAVKQIKAFAQKVMGTNDVRLDVRLNKAVWMQGIRNVPVRLRVLISRRRNDDEDAKVCSAEQRRMGIGGPTFCGSLNTPSRSQGMRVACHRGFCSLPSVVMSCRHEHGRSWGHEHAVSYLTMCTHPPHWHTRRRRCTPL